MDMEFPERLERYRLGIEEELRACLDQRNLPLYRMIQYQMGWVDESGAPREGRGAERLRSSLCLLSCTALGGEVAVALSAAAAVEMVHNFSLVHGDIHAGSPEQNNRATVWWLWGPAQAINAGDGMHALARLALFRLAQHGVPHQKVLDAVQLLDEASLRLCEGQYLDLSYQERINVTQGQYFEMAEKKTGALMGCAMQMGALLATDDEALAQAFGECGRKLGVAFQVRDDLLSLWGSARGTEGQPAPPGSVLNKSKLLPVVYALERAALPQKRELGNLYFKRVMEPPDVAKVVQVLEALGAREYTQEQAESIAGEAVALLEAQGITGDALGDLRLAAQYLVQRPR